MERQKKRRIATAAVIAAVGIGAVTQGLRAAPAVERAIGRLRSPKGASTAAPVAGDGGSGTVQQVVDTGGGPAAVAQSIAQFQKNGTYTGRREYAYYGYVRVQAVVENGSLTNVKAIEYPNDNGRSLYISQVALPYLIQEAVDAQSYRVDFISGATFTSSAFAKSLRDALSQAGPVTPAAATRQAST